MLPLRPHRIRSRGRSVRSAYDWPMAVHVSFRPLPLSSSAAAVVEPTTATPSPSSTAATMPHFSFVLRSFRSLRFAHTTAAARAPRPRSPRAAAAVRPATTRAGSYPAARVNSPRNADKVEICQPRRPLLGGSGCTSSGIRAPHGEEREGFRCWCRARVGPVQHR